MYFYPTVQKNFQKHQGQLWWLTIIFLHPDCLSFRNAGVAKIKVKTLIMHNNLSIFFIRMGKIEIGKIARVSYHITYVQVRPFSFSSISEHSR